MTVSSRTASEQIQQALEQIRERWRGCRAAVYGTPRDKAFQQALDDITTLAAAIEALQQTWIKPLLRSDDPEEAEALRVTPEYVLYDRKAADQEAALWHSWRDRAEAAEAQRTEGAAALARAQQRIAELERALGFDHPWPAHDVLNRLADAADHLLREHNCDVQGWEGIGVARDRARVIAAVLSRPTGAEGA